MPSHSLPSALVTDKGRRVLLRLYGRQYELDQSSLRSILGVPDGPPGVGIIIERHRLQFEFAADEKIVKISVAQLRRRLARQEASKA